MGVSMHHSSWFAL